MRFFLFQANMQAVLQRRLWDWTGFLGSMWARAVWDMVQPCFSYTFVRLVFVHALVKSIRVRIFFHFLSFCLPEDVRVCPVYA